MPRTCTVCKHPELDAINRALTDNETLWEIAGKYGLSKSSVDRHRADHLPAQLIAAREATKLSNAIDLLGDMQKLQKVTMGILGRAVNSEDYRTALNAIREARGNVEILGELLGELKSQPTVNILITSPEWIKTRTTLMRALEPYLDARLAVVAALKEVDHVA